MRFTTAGVLATCVAAAAAFKDTSPFILFSNSELSPSTLSSKQIQSSTNVVKGAKEVLSQCPSDIYVIVSQSTLNAADFGNSKTFPYLRRWMGSDEIKGRVSVSEVSGNVKTADLEEYLMEHCGAKAMKNDEDISRPEGATEPYVFRRVYSDVPGVDFDRATILAHNDLLLNEAYELLTLTGVKYTVIYVPTSVVEKEVTHRPSKYEAHFQQPLHMAVKRQFDVEGRAEETAIDSRPLFEKYQFFTPGIFMGLLVSFLLLAILAVGINGVASLQVSYAAFDKEMGPAAQRKA